MLTTEIWMFDELYFLSARVSYHQISTLTMVILMITAANVTFHSCAFNISFTFGGCVCRFARWSKMFYCRNGNLVLGFSLLFFLHFFFARSSWTVVSCRCLNHSKMYARRWKLGNVNVLLYIKAMIIHHEPCQSTSSLCVIKPNDTKMAHNTMS